MADAAKRAREVAAKELADAIRLAEKQLHAANPNLRILRQRITRIEEREARFRETHYTYLDKAKISLDDEDETAYLTERTDKAIDCMDLCFELIPEETANPPPPATDTTNLPVAQLTDRKVRCKEIRRQISIDEKFADQLVVKLKQTLDNPQLETLPTKDIISSVKAHDNKLCETLVNLDLSWKALITNVESDEEDAETTHINDKRWGYQDIHTQVLELIDKRSQEVVPTAETDVASMLESVVSNTSRSNSSSLMVRPERMKHPVFSGNVRLYASFKKDFKLIVQPFHSDDSHQAFVMKQCCLSGEPKSLVANLETMDSIWKRLDDKYGDKLDIVEVIIKELEALPPVKVNDDAKFVLMVDTLEKGLLDLDAIDARAEIANAYTVKMMESKISRQMYLTWLEKEEAEGKEKVSEVSEEEEETGSVVNVNRFEKLYEFLISERKKRMRLMKRGTEKPAPPSPPPPPPAGGGRHSANGATGNYNNQQPTNKCLLHPNGYHFTRKCKLFKSKSVEEQAAIVNEKKACHLCLSVDHIGQPCPKQATWGPCNHSNCGKFHLNILHEADVRGLLMCLKLNAVSFSVVDPAQTQPSTPLVTSPTTTSTSVVSARQSSTIATVSASASTHNINVLLLIQRVPTGIGYFITVFFDSGSTLSLVSKSFVKRHGLR